MAALVLVSCLVTSRAADRPLTAGGADSLSLEQARLAMRRSLLLPGWGQATNGEWIKAAALGVAEVGLLLGARVQHTKWQDWKERREDAFEGNDPTLQVWTLQREEFFLDDRNKLLWWWMFVRLGGVLDAYVGGAMSNFSDEGPLVLRRVHLGPSVHLPGVSVTWALPQARRNNSRGR